MIEQFLFSYFYLKFTFLWTLSITLCFIFQYGIIYLIYGFITDQAELLEEKMNDLQSVLSSMDGHVLKIDPSYLIIMTNKSIFGKNEQELIGTCLSNLPIFDVNRFDDLKKTKKTQKWETETKEDGKSCLYSVTASPILKGDEILAITVMCINTTYELENKRKETEHENQIVALKSKTEFIASISHEIRNPLQALTFSIENLVAMDPRSDQIGILKEAKHSNEMINYIIGDILDTSKIESGKMKLQSKEFEILEAIESSLKMNISAAFKKSLSVKYSLDLSIPSVLVGDYQRIVQIFSNLISNAIKYTNKGNIEFNVKNIEKSNHHFIHFSIRDSGIGIDEENISKVFELFEQIHDSNGTNVRGWGLGLPIVKGLVELMNGTYGLESEIGLGSNFWFEIPYEKTNETISLMDSLPASPYHTAILVLKKKHFVNEISKILKAMDVTNILHLKSKEKISDSIQNLEEYKIFVETDLITEIPPSIPHKNVIIIGNLSVKESEYNDCLRSYNPILPSDIILSMAPSLKKKNSSFQNPLEGLTVMIVEDHIVIQRTLKKLIEKMGAKFIFIASNGQEALECCHEQKYIDLIISDLNMPIMSGYEFLKTIRSTNVLKKEPKVIVMTGDMNNQKLSEFAKEWNVDDVLSKPISKKSLMDSIKLVLRKNLSNLVEYFNNK
jgi:signal transduction histidine kinase/ActR/RegA family two-component response regulator